MATRVKRKTDTGLKAWEHPKGSGITIREVVNTRGDKAYDASYRVIVPSKITGKQRLFKQFKEETKAFEWADEQFKGSQLEGADYFKITDAQRTEIRSAFEILDQYGLGLLEAVEFAAPRMKPIGGERTFGDVVEELKEVKLRCNLRESTLKDFRLRTEKLKDLFNNALLKDLTKEQLESTIDGLKNAQNDKPLGPRSKKNYLMVIAEIYRFAISKKYVVENPLTTLDKAERKALVGDEGESKDPTILSVKEAESLLKAAHENQNLDLLAPIVLALFCGLRTGELKNLQWKHLHIEDEAEPFVQIPRGLGKGRYIRNIPIPENALRWLELCERKGKKVARENDDMHGYFRKRFQKLYKLAGIKQWDENCMRHSFGSYFFSLSNNLPETMARMGHREDRVLFQHYRALTTKKQAEQYFNIDP